MVESKVIEEVEEILAKIFENLPEIEDQRQKIK